MTESDDVKQGRIVSAVLRDGQFWVPVGVLALGLLLLAALR